MSRDMGMRPAAILLATIAFLASAGLAAAAGSKLSAQPPVSLPSANHAKPRATPQPGAVPVGQLARTGIDLRVMVVLAVGLLSAGGALRLGVAPERPSPQ